MQQTASIMRKYITNVPIKEDAELYEIGEEHHELFYLSDHERNEFMKKNKKIVDLQEMMKNEKNKFKKHEMSKEFNREATKLFKIKPLPKKVFIRYARFLNSIKKSGFNQVLVVCHGGTINGMKKIICGYDMHSQVTFEKVKNCSIMCVQYDLAKDWFQLISTDDDHLK
jgi:broad specificity phosphatase PhoE